jgi:hypothetical protein
MPVMEPSERPVSLGLAANWKVISQSSSGLSPRFEPLAPRNSTSPGAKPLKPPAFVLPVQLKIAPLYDAFTCASLK